jgi:hypothetical protein
LQSSESLNQHMIHLGISDTPCLSYLILLLFLTNVVFLASLKKKL